MEFIEGATFFDDISNEEFRNRKFMEKIVGNYAHLLTDINYIRNALDSLGIDVYEWSDNPAVKNKIKNMATVEYNAGGSDKAIKTIDRMDSDQLRSWLKQLAKKDIDLGVKIIVNGGKYCFIGGGDVYGRHLAYVDSYCRANHTSPSVSAVAKGAGIAKTTA